MADIRLVRRLHAYSGGTVRDSHPVPFALYKAALPRSYARNPITNAIIQRLRETVNLDLKFSC